MSFGSISSERGRERVTSILFTVESNSHIVNHYGQKVTKPCYRDSTLYTDTCILPDTGKNG